MAFDQADRKQIIDQLNSKIADYECPICKSKSFVLSDGYIFNAVQKSRKKLNVSGEGILTIPLICKNCGFVSQHCATVLGLDNLDK